MPFFNTKFELGMKNGDVKKGDERLINGRIKDTRFATSMHCLHIIVINSGGFPSPTSNRIFFVCKFYIPPRTGDGRLVAYTLHWRLDFGFRPRQHLSDGYANGSAGFWGSSDFGLLVPRKGNGLVMWLHLATAALVVCFCLVLSTGGLAHLHIASYADQT